MRDKSPSGCRSRRPESSSSVMAGGTWAADFEIVDQLIFGKRCGAETV
ncbi:hypothetical protein N9747_01220 [Planktomarina sp.]|nr:hypothetical protein [Planktomarina sp.]